MTFYEELVMQTQTNFSKYYGMYASGKTPYILTKKKPLPYSNQAIQARAAASQRLLLFSFHRASTASMLCRRSMLQQLLDLLDHGL